MTTHVLFDEKSKLELLCRLLINVFKVLFSSYGIFKSVLKLLYKELKLAFVSLTVASDNVLSARAILTSGSQTVTRALAS